ncbi:hypothetical protein EVAR_86269_1 [Eumeta japonica]|uniref:Uncharacterized protein n=1 Tax=Eumeta variegata TaxID=151549 RepID=A0A4C1UD51_EUMVA|nr:hypothetical protein EVAR_86269_1 [Eumeta japonica]
MFAKCVSGCARARMCLRAYVHVRYKSYFGTSVYPCFFQIGTLTGSANEITSGTENRIDNRAGVFGTEHGTNVGIKCRIKSRIKRGTGIGMTSSTETTIRSGIEIENEVRIEVKLIGIKSTAGTRMAKRIAIGLENREKHDRSIYNMKEFILCPRGLSCGRKLV